TMDEAAKDLIADAAYDPIYGARPLKRFLTQHVETPLARELIMGKWKDGDAITITRAEDSLAFTHQAA
ncbi:MAG: hypothetical protein LDL27_11660, partial [Desulfovibrio sp.]|nr:hypothetical protein [Desulfovibrio sp.]